MPPRKANLDSAVKSASKATSDAAVAEPVETRKMPSLSGLNLGGLKPPPEKPVANSGPFDTNESTLVIPEIKLGALAGLKKAPANGKLSSVIKPHSDTAKDMSTQVEDHAGSVDSRMENLINAKFAILENSLREVQQIIKSTFIDFQQKIDKTLDQSADAISRMLRLEEVQQELCLHLADIGKDPSSKLQDHNNEVITSLPGPLGGETPSEILRRLGLDSAIATELSTIVGQNVGSHADAMVTAVAEQLQLSFDDCWMLFEAFGWIDPLNRTLYMS